jgi:hypothetical protein
MSFPALHQAFAGTPSQGFGMEANFDAGGIGVNFTPVNTG